MTATVDRLSPAQVNELLLAPGGTPTLYLVGIGGCGMSGLAHLLLDAGYAVYGSDLAPSEIIRQLSARGALIHVGHAGEHLRAARPWLVAYSSAIPLNNPELIAAHGEHIPIVRRAVLLAALLHRQRGICVAGMHGKTTTTSLLAFALDRLGAHPSYAIGATVPQLAQHARLSHPAEPTLALPNRATREDNWFVIEADESDGTLRSFRPEHAILLNVDEEHLDFYANLEAVCQEFDDFAAQTSDRLVFCADDSRLVELFGSRPHSVSFGYHAQAQYRIVPCGIGSRQNTSASVPGPTRFELWHADQCLGAFSICLVGEKNVSNAAAVIALLDQMGFAPTAIAHAIAPFQGAARRQHQLFADDHFRVFDDYGHHPREISATLRALKDLGAQRLLVAFQPHRYTRTHHLLCQFASSFGLADKLWLTEIYAASEPPIAGVNGATLAAAVRATGQPVEFVPALADLGRAIRAEMRTGDIVLFMGAGDITLAAHRLAEELSRGVSGGSVEQHLGNLTSLLSPATVVKAHDPLAKRTTFRVGGKADLYVEPGSEEDLRRVLDYCQRVALPLLVIGRGSNLLVRDGGLRGVVLCLAQPAFCGIEVQGASLRCGAGAKLKAVVMEARQKEITGLEFLEGIPGTVGGALRMNAGAMGASIFQVLEQVRFMDPAGHVQECSPPEIPVEYRSCRFFEKNIAVSAVLQGRPGTREEIDARLKAFSARRWKSQPAVPSAGCVFKNPTLMPAGRLIDELGLKGTRIGGAVVSDVHGNFIVNDANATAEDILHLIRLIQDRAQNQRGINLETEIQIIGEGIYG